MATLASISTATPTPTLTSAPSSLLNQKRSQDSDYGSDFSEGEEDIVNQLLQGLNDKDPAIPTFNTAIPSTAAASISTPHIGSVQTSADNSTIAPDISIPFASLQGDPQHHVSTTPTAQATFAPQGFPSGAAKKPAPIHGSRTRHSDNTYGSWPEALNHGVSYPDCEFPLVPR